MKQQIQIDITDLETRVAVLEDGRLLDLHIERSNQQTLVGNIYKGKVVRVLPGMQAAFVDIGLQRTGFLHVRDLVGSSTLVSRRDQAKALSIDELLHEGQFLVVQVSKDPINEKGARLSTDISIASRNLVYLPRATQLAMSKKIKKEFAIERITQLVERWIQQNQSADMNGNYIVRTQAEDLSDHQLLNDLRYLKAAWQQFQNRVKTADIGKPLHTDLSLLLRSLRDEVDANTQSVLINCPIAFGQAQQFTHSYLPDIADVISLYQNEEPLFSLNEVESQIQLALAPTVSLPSGGNLVIEQTEAMVTVDVNSGSNTGSYSGEQKELNVAYLTNLEASIEIARQSRLRNLAGIIVIDFIDMQKIRHKKEVLSSLQAALEKDSVPVDMGEMSGLGLVEFTRKRTLQSWQQVTCEPCSTCAGQGWVKSAETVCHEIFREVVNATAKVAPKALTVIAAPTVVERLGESKRAYLEKLQVSLRCSIQLVSEPHYLPSQFDVAFT